MPRSQAAPVPDPLPTPANTITCGRARFVLFTERMLRLEWAADGRFEDRPTLAVDNRAAPAVRHEARRAGRALVIRTAGFELRYTDDGRPFSPANLRVAFRLRGRRRTWTPGRAAAGNLGGTIRTLDQTKGAFLGQYVPAGGRRKKPGTRWVPIDLGQGLVSRDGWALVDDSAGIPLEGEPGWVVPRPAGERRDWYLLLHGDDYKGALRDATLVLGRQPLPPRFAFGYWWSRYWAYTDREVEDLVAQFDERRVPLDVLVLDMDWHLEGWTGYTWDRRYFPDPRDFLRRMRARGLKVTLNLHPADGVGRQEEAFPAMARALGLDPRTAERVPMDVTDRAYVEAYFRLLHHPLERQGVDFWWMDWQQGTTTPVPGLDPLPWINLLHWRDMETNPARRGRRPLIFSRYGGPGAGRYCVGFSGDTYSVWESLQYQPRFTATASNALYGYWSHDIGGHMPGPIEPELYARWIQFGVFSPVLRTHTSKNPDAERRVWAYPDPYGGIMADALRLRHELVPYIYGQARRGWETGLGLCRPMYYDWPREAAAYRCPDQYMFGDDLLVAPVLRPADPASGLAEVSVWLPPGRWFDTARGAFVAGGGLRRLRYLAAEIPVFVRPGAVVPAQRAGTRLAPGPYRDLVLTAYPGGEGACELFEDDGEGEGYRRGEGAWIPMAQRRRPGGRAVAVGPVRGAYAGFAPLRTLEVRLPATAPPAAVRADGRALRWALRLGAEGWTWDAAQAAVVIRLRRVDLRRGVTVEVDEARGGVLPGLKGLLARLDLVNHHNTLSTHCLVLDPEERLGVDAAQAGNRIARRPGTWRAELRRLGALLDRLPAMFRRLGDATNAWSPVPSPERRARCARAVALLQATREDFGRPAAGRAANR